MSKVIIGKGPTVILRNAEFITLPWSQRNKTIDKRKKKRIKKTMTIRAVMCSD
jgi:hypothetical protein